MGIDDSPLVSDKIMIVGAIMRGGEWLEGVLRTDITRDGFDATVRLSEMICGSKHYGQIRAVMLNGITFGGFNIVDLRELYERTRLPVIVIMREMPDMEKIKEALKNLSDPEGRYEMITRAGNIIKVQTIKRGKPIFIQAYGIEAQDAANIVQATSIHSRIPEPIRVAHIIATGVILGESKKRA
nr:DUF99 family protein [Methanocella sp. CWC-04]